MWKSAAEKLKSTPRNRQQRRRRRTTPTACRGPQRSGGRDDYRYAGLGEPGGRKCLAVSQTDRHEPDRKAFVRPDRTPVGAISAIRSIRHLRAKQQSRTQGANDGWCQGGLSKAVGHEDRLVGEAHHQQKVGKKNCCEEREGHSGSNGRGSETAPSPAQPGEAAVKSPTAQAATDPVAAAPTVATTPTTFAAPSVGQLTHAFVYLTHLPVALIHPTDENPEAK